MTATYVEPPRGYRGLAGTVVFLAALIVLDGLLGGLAGHVIAWVVIVAVLLGVHALLIHAARVNKTLTIDAEQIRIGEEVVERARVAAVTAEVDEDAPVLGWPAGVGRRRRSLTLVLEDGQRVRVPTRAPDVARLQLGVQDAAVLDAGVRPAGPDDLPLLAEVDERSDALFTVAGLRLPERPGDGPSWDSAAAVLVAGLPPVGFVRVDVVDGCAHLTEVAVLPGSMRRGVGGRLIEAACDWAREHGHDAITLTTYADVPWNAPMYARHGWVQSSALGPGLTAIRAREVADGLDGVGPRIVMRRKL